MSSFAARLQAVLLAVWPFDSSCTHIWQDVSAAICALLYALLVWGSFDLAAGRSLGCAGIAVNQGSWFRIGTAFTIWDMPKLHGTSHGLLSNENDLFYALFGMAPG